MSSKDKRKARRAAERDVAVEVAAARVPQLEADLKAACDGLTAKTEALFMYHEAQKKLNEELGQLRASVGILREEKAALKQSAEDLAKLAETLSAQCQDQRDEIAALSKRIREMDSDERSLKKLRRRLQERGEQLEKANRKYNGLMHAVIAERQGRITDAPVIKVDEEGEQPEENQA